MWCVSKAARHAVAAAAAVDDDNSRDAAVDTSAKADEDSAEVNQVTASEYAQACWTSTQRQCPELARRLFGRSAVNSRPAAASQLALADPSDQQ